MLLDVYRELRWCSAGDPRDTSSIFKHRGLSSFLHNHSRFAVCRRTKISVTSIVPELLSLIFLFKKRLNDGIVCGCVFSFTTSLDREVFSN